MNKITRFARRGWIALAGALSLAAAPALAQQTTGGAPTPITPQ